MGRPRLYNTQEEKLQARRVQSKNYYERSTISNHTQICHRMCCKYKRKARRETEVKEQESTGSNGVRYKDQESTGSDNVMYDEISRFCMIDLNLESRLNNPIKTLNQAKIAFDEKTQGDKYKYIDDIVKECIASPGSALEFCKVTASLWVDLVDYIQSCLGKVLQEYGCGILSIKVIPHAVSLHKLQLPSTPLSNGQTQDWPQKNTARHFQGRYSVQAKAKGLGKPEPADEIARHLKKTQDDVLKALLPSYFLARAAGQSNKNSLKGPISKVSWMLFLFPEQADAESPPKHSWNAELNSAIQKIMNGLPTPMIGLEELEKAIVGPSLGETTQEDTSSKGDFDFNFLYCPAGCYKGKSKFVVVRDDKHDNKLHIGHSRTVQISDNGFRILQTPRSPVKVSSAQSRPLIEQEFDDWNPCIEYEDAGEESPLINVEENVQGTMAAKVAAKRQYFPFLH
ncbi:uncharacterized protein LACBIDRAFT_327895 [Laccaria bicolor S238N-H82]|uniref:Predicted protein n=1 Tax=Laccaria bicolor (strain S238N-H82 / ATCC MYA-4686) TaxID=486041 RepID=B0DD55_LACBS|nr:uncharacterized protein LACBIDRAFT_327895 [Laccaria bicolor S238N-H82]EDR07549.1 predicted protein [Laccaria bicolor S238N-H82]|eukprot:XP_001881941.1 predicted protein [Laccaria bicolor S238N-H82]